MKRRALIAAYATAAALLYAAFVAWFLSLAWPARAANTDPDWPIPPCADRAPLPKPVNVKASCAPADVGGTGTAAVLEVNATGAAVGWWCVDPIARTRGYVMRVVKWAALTPDMLASTLRMMAHRGADWTTIEAELVARNATMHVLDMCDVYGNGWRQRLNLSMPDLPPEPPPGPRYVVTASGSGTTRLAYLVASGGARGAVDGLATVGAPCDCAARMLTLYGGLLTYCRVPAAALVGGDPQAEHITVCSLQR